jgi:hypothetical protein
LSTKRSGDTTIWYESLFTLRDITNGKFSVVF